MYENLRLTQEQTTLFCRGLLDLAAVDGLHHNEIALVQEFFAGSGGDPTELEALAAQGFDLASAAQSFDQESSEAFLMSCYMLIYADGKHSDEERARIGEYAAGLGVTASRLQEIHDLTRSFLLQNLAATLSNQGAVEDVGEELGLNEDKILNMTNKEG
tara:strand:+ start:114 stop:590 length:477 start_codon:yes stop_codon:yes gene_type:complete